MKKECVLKSVFNTVLLRNNNVKNAKNYVKK